MEEMNRVTNLLSRLDLTVLGKKVDIQICYDKESEDILRIHGEEPRIYIQMSYTCPDIKNPDNEVRYKGGKWYLSKHSIDDEIVKKCYLAFRTLIEHEVLEGFKVDGKTLFNPHVDFEELLAISHLEVTRKQKVEIY